MTRSQAIARRLCPRCRSGAIFEPGGRLGWRHMYPYCPACGLKYSREAGYFLGAMYISYGFGLVVIALVTAALWYFAGLTFMRAVLWACAALVPLTPTIAVWSRVLWIHFDQAVDPARD